jgi:hypothetical protein
MRFRLRLLHRVRDLHETTLVLVISQQCQSWANTGL